MMPAPREAWKTTTLGEIAKVTSGGTPSRKEPSYWNGDIPWVTTSLIDFNTITTAEEFISAEGVENSSAKVFPKGILLMAMFGQGVTRGKVAVLGIDAAFNQACVGITPSKDANAGYLYQYLAHSYESIRKLSNSGSQENLNAALIKGIHVPLPALPEQEKIASVVFTWDRGIRQLTDLIAAKLRFKQGLMQQLLTGKRRFPEFREEWKQVRIGDLVSVRKDARTPSDDCPLYSLTIEDGITPKSERYDRLALVRDKGNKTYKVVRPADIVFNPSNLRWGAIGISRESHDVVVSPIYEVVYVSDESVTDPNLLFQALSAPHQIARFATMCEGTLVERMAVKLPTFLNCHIPFPPTFAEQKQIAEALRVADRGVDLLRKQLEALKQQKKGLMQKLLTGEVRVKP